MIQTKACSRCDKEFPLTTLFFYKRKLRTGEQSWYPHCKLCRSEMVKEDYRKRADRKVDRTKLTAENNYKITAKIKNQPYASSVIDALKNDPSRSNHWLASETGATYPYVATARRRLEATGEIPFVTETINENGDWRRRLIQKKKANDPYGDIQVVYFIREANNISSLIKIGTTNCMTRRFNQYVEHSPVDLEIIHVVRGNSIYEKDIHILFKEHRVRGEWFRPAPDLLSFIEELKVSQSVLNGGSYLDILKIHANTGFEPDRNKQRMSFCNAKQKGRSYRILSKNNGDFFDADVLQQNLPPINGQFG